MTKQKVNITETVLRDAGQSLVATRIPFSQMEPALHALDTAGYYSVECWGGATFDVCLRYLNEDPWERLRKLKAGMKNTKLQMLLRGQNILGYKPYPDDIVRRFVRLSIKNGIDIIRIFDALNDLENIKVAVDETLKCGGIASGAISYTESPVHTIEAYVKMAKELESMGVASICIKDMAGIMTPAKAYELVSAIKKNVKLKVCLHSHCTTGMAYMTYLKAVEAGVDIIDCAISPFSGGTSQPATEAMVEALEELGYPLDIDKDIVYSLVDGFKQERGQYIKDGILNPISLTTDTQGLVHQVPGGMLSNLLSQLKAISAEDKFEEALKEVPRVREDMGYPPLVTPTSQIIGTQAVQNVLAGERYKTVGSEIKGYCKGEYGRTPAPINEELRKKILDGEEPIKGRYADTLPTDTFETAKKELGDMAKSEEDVLSYIAFPQVAMDFFKKRREEEEKRVEYSIEKVED